MKDVDTEEPTPFLDHVYLECTQRECTPYEKIIGQHNEMFGPRISAGATEKLPGWDKPRAKTSAWSYDMEGHARKCVERYCEVADEKTEQLYKVSHPCLDDHQVKQEELENKGEMSEVCSHIVFKILYLARIGRPDILWSVNKLARSVTKWTQACDRRLARLISNVHFTSDYRQYCHVRNAAQHCRCFFLKIQTLQEIFKTQNQHQAEFCAFWEVEHLYRSVGCARSKRQCLTALQNQRSYRWLLVCVWTVYLRLTYGIWSLKCWERPRECQKPTQACTRETGVKTQITPKIKQVLD